VPDDGIEHARIIQLVLGSAAHAAGDFGDGELLGGGLGDDGEEGEGFAVFTPGSGQRIFDF